MDEYTNKFYNLHKRNNTDELEFWTITKYISGLQQEIQDEIVDMIWYLGSIVARAKKLEEMRQ